MEIKKILKQLEKEKDKLKYLEKQLKNTNSKKQKEKIEKLIAKTKKQTEKQAKEEKAEKSKANLSSIPSLEQIAGSIARPARVETEALELENYQSRARTRIAIPSGISAQTETPSQEGYADNYGSNIQSDYIRTKQDFNRKLETSGLITKAGFTTTAESKEAIRRQAGTRQEYLNERNNIDIQTYHELESAGMARAEEELVGLSRDLKQAKRSERESNYVK